MPHIIDACNKSTKIDMGKTHSNFERIVATEKKEERRAEG